MDNQGEPKGNDQHAVPHFAYEPIITLFNPYDVALDLKKLRIRVWDPPVGFRFAKISKEKGFGWYRQEMASGEFHPLARLNIANEHNASARRSFTLYLTDGTSEAVGTTLRLQPGEVKVFSSRVESVWCWAFESANTWAPRSFFDWNAGSDFRITDEVQVDVQPQRATAGITTIPDFQVDVLAGTTEDVTKDILRSYRFRFADPVAEISENPKKPVISRKFLVSQTLQKWNDKSVAGKKPIAMLEMTARTTKDPLDDSKAWIYNNPVVEGGEQNSSIVGAANQSYDVRLIELTGWSSFPMIEWDATKGPGCWTTRTSSTTRCGTAIISRR